MYVFIRLKNTDLKVGIDEVICKQVIQYSGLRLAKMPSVPIGVSGCRFQDSCDDVAHQEKKIEPPTSINTISGSVGYIWLLG
jgi:hypothetical protein